MKLLKTVFCLMFLIVGYRVPYALDWPTFGHDPQRSGYAPEESTLDAHSVGQLELKWKVQVKDEAKSLTVLTAPVVAADVDTLLGVKTVLYLAGSDNHLFALDARDGRMI